MGVSIEVKQGKNMSHKTGSLEVRGSIPLSSTMFYFRMFLSSIDFHLNILRYSGWNI